uniref:Lipocalin n=1 Tax=Rhipicephalus appendiculatus TaxID=34631 RepID=A0A131YFV7_RHIAP
MKPFFFGLLALCVLVFFNASTSSGEIIMPGNSSDPVVLVGYSSEMEQEGITCVKSQYLYRDTEWINRTLEYKYKMINHDTNVDQEEKTTIKFKVWKYCDVLEVGTKTWLVTRSGGNYTYQVRYYDNTSLVLSNYIRNISVLEPCSLWVKIQYANNFTELANETFHKLCRKPKFVGYDLRACQDRYNG